MRTDVKHLFRRKYGTEGQSLDDGQLLRAIERHTSYVITRDNLLRSLAEQLSKVATMRQSGSSTERRVETLISYLESFSVYNLQADAVYRTTSGRCKPELSREFRWCFSRLALQTEGTRIWRDQSSSISHNDTRIQRRC